MRARPPAPVAQAELLEVIASTGTSLGAGSQPAKSAKRIHLVEREAQVSFVDQGKNGLSPGDQRLVSSTISTPGGRLIGQAEFDCTITEPLPMLVRPAMRRASQRRVRSARPLLSRRALGERPGQSSQ